MRLSDVNGQIGYPYLIAPLPNLNAYNVFIIRIAESGKWKKSIEEGGLGDNPLIVLSNVETPLKKLQLTMSWEWVSGEGIWQLKSAYVHGNEYSQFLMYQSQLYQILREDGRVRWQNDEV